MTSDIIEWGSDESAGRGFHAGEFVVFTSGSYSDYGIDRVVQATRAISGAELQLLAAEMPVTRDGQIYRYPGHFVDMMVSKGLFLTPPCVEINAESLDHFRHGAETRTPRMKFELSQIE